MSSCNGNCSECGSDCADRKPESLLAELNPNASVKKVIAVVSGLSLIHICVWRFWHPGRSRCWTAPG